MSRATEQEAYKNWVSLFKSRSSCDYVSQKCPFFPTWSASKNLLLKSRKGKQIYLVILPDEKHADLKQLAEQLKEKRLSFVSEEQLPDLPRRSSRYSDSISIDARKRKIQVVIDAAIDRQDTVGFHPNINTTTLIMDFSDFEKILVYLEHLPVYENL